GQVCARLALLAILGAMAASCDDGVKDEATQAGLSEKTLTQADEDYFHDMDNGIALTPDEVQGRNMWLVWSGGNDRFWDWMGKPTFGGFDLLKIVAPPPGSDNERPRRWKTLGLINEPCFGPPLADGDPARFGLRLDMRRGDCPPDPFANAEKYPGAKIGARGATFKDGTVFSVGSYYGEPSGILGLRLFTNPDFDEKAKAAWDAKRYYSDPAYYSDPRLIKPYRVGMSCGFCHLGPSPINPPADPVNPEFANLNSTVGAQYMWVDRLFLVEPNKRNFMYQLVQTYRPGAMDTSLVSTDNINNPRTMNAVYNLKARLEIAKHIGHEKLKGGEQNNKQFNDFVDSGWLAEFFKKPDEVWTPHVLKDGADSVGALGALNRVYINIGLFSEEWLQHFNAVVGGKPITPIEIKTAEDNSAYWRATEQGTVKTALFFLKAAQPDRLADAPGGSAHLSSDSAVLARGREAFANTCARCHSSKAPTPPADLAAGDCNGPEYMTCFKKWWTWTQTDEFKSEMRTIVDSPDFLTDNYLSSDARIPVTLLRTNACSPLATNALAGNIWDNFSSSSYKSLPSVGKVTFQDPFDGHSWSYDMPAGGRGYTRVPSLVSLWSTAPFLLNNTVGPFYGDPSVEGRMRVFQESIEQMLWPERRPRDVELGDKVDGWIDRTDSTSHIFLPVTYISAIREKLGKDGDTLFSTLADADGNLVLSNIPKGMPVNLLANLKPLAETKDPSDLVKHYVELLKLLVSLKEKVLTAPTGASDEEMRAHFASVRDDLMKLNKCPDFVVNRGHYFGTAKFNDNAGLTDDERAFGAIPALSDDDKRALIEFLKTF
ncbi:MAG: hypothetical protein ACREEP_09060, partial [Dongiaceae bacterium]